MASGDLTLAVVGAAGLVGHEVLDLLAERRFPAGDVRLLGSARTAGAEVERPGGSERLAPLGPGSFEGVDVAFFAAGPGVAGEWVPQAAAAGAAVIDCSSRFRLDDAVPLVVPEVNAAAVGDFREQGVVASPSATAVALAVVLAPLAAAAGLERVVAATYQGVSGAGRNAMHGLSQETVGLLNARDVRRTRFARRIAFNCIPQVGTIAPGGTTTHEALVAEEIRKILGDPALAVGITAVRVPMFFGYAVAVHLETEQPLGAEDAATALRGAPGVLLHEGPAGPYPTPLEVVATDATHVGRLRDDPSAEHGLALWIACDNVRRGRALNAVAIAEILARDHL